MLPKLALVAAALAAAPFLVSAAVYPLAEGHAGKDFFNGWTFYDHYDNLTNSDVQYVNSSSNPSLAYVNDTTSNAILKVSTETVIYENKRNSVRISLDNLYDVGTVWVLDAVHIPVGCSVWPAFWTTSLTWPFGGEIDIVEAINQQTSSQSALHSIGGCEPVVDQTKFTGAVEGTNCNATGNAGCKTNLNNNVSAGKGFNDAKGGVWITELAESGVSVWFYSRNDIPSSITSGAESVDTSTLGTPAAFWSNNGCSPIDKFFYAQQTVLNIALCGDWAGVSSIMGETGCTAPVAPATCYSTYVVDNSPGFQGFSEAFWEIQYMNIYSSAKSSGATASASSAAASGSGKASSAATTGSGAIKASASASAAPVSAAFPQAQVPAWAQGALAVAALGGALALF